jgi:hypothetical protein
MRNQPHAGGVLQLPRHRPEVVLEDPDRDRQRERRVGQDQRAVGVEQVERAHHQVERDDDRDARHHPRQQVDDQQHLAAAEPDARERVGGERAEHEVHQRRRERHHHAVQQCVRRVADRVGPDEGLVGARVHESEVVRQGRIVRQEMRRHRRGVHLVHEAHVDDPVERHHEVEREPDRQGVQNEFPGHTSIRPLWYSVEM